MRFAFEVRAELQLDHCGAGSPRFEVVTTSGTVEFGPGCNPATSSTIVGSGWIRLRWTVDLHNVKAIYIAFDEGQDIGPDNFGIVSWTTST
jgi:hypothetical protein